MENIKSLLLSLWDAQAKFQAPLFLKWILISGILFLPLGCEQDTFYPSSERYYLRIEPGLRDLCLNSWAQMSLSSNVPSLTLEDIEWTAEVDGKPIGQITENGFFRAPSSIEGALQKVKVKATWLANPTVVATATMNVYANQENTFVEVFNGFGNYSEPGSLRLLYTRNGSYLLTGRQPEDFYSFKVLNMDAVGNITWRRSYGTGDSYDIKPSEDGGFLVSGSLILQEGGTSAVVFKIDVGGFASWQQNYGPGAARAIAVDERNGNFVVATDKIDNQDPTDYILLTKADRRGNVIWSKSLGKGTVEQIRTAEEGGFLIAAYLPQQEGNSVLGMIKIDENGSIEWTQQRIGVPGFAVETLPENTGFLVAYTSPENGNSVMAVSKLTPNGQWEWTKRYESNKPLVLGDIHLNSEKQEIVLIGSEEGEGSNSNIFMLRTDMEGNESWRRSIGRGNLRGKGLAIEKTGEGGFVALGTLYSQNVLIKTDEEGVISPCEDFIN